MKLIHDCDDENDGDAHVHDGVHDVHGANELMLMMMLMMDMKLFMIAMMVLMMSPIAHDDAGDDVYDVCVHEGARDVHDGAGDVRGFITSIYLKPSFEGSSLQFT